MSTPPGYPNMPENTQITKTSLVLSGNAYVDGAPQRGWFIGHFLEDACGLRATPSLEVKWNVYHAGEEKPLWGVSRTATTLCMLIKGKITIWFPITTCILFDEGDFVIWPAGIPHRWMIEEEAIVLTIRWPSAAADYCEQVQSEMTNQCENQ